MATINATPTATHSNEQPARGASPLNNAAPPQRHGEEAGAVTSPRMPLRDGSIRGALLLVLINAAALIWVVSVQALALASVCIDAVTAATKRPGKAAHGKHSRAVAGARAPAPPAAIAKSPRPHQQEGGKTVSTAAATTKPALRRAAADTPSPRRPASAPGRPPLLGACSLAAAEGLAATAMAALPLELRRRHLPPRPAQHQQQHQHPPTLQRAASAEPVAAGLSLLRAPSPPPPIFKAPAAPEGALVPPAAPVKAAALHRSVSAGLPQAATRPPLLPPAAALCAPQPPRRRHSGQAPPQGSSVEQKQANSANAAAARPSAEELFAGLASYRTRCRCATCRFAAEFCSRSQQGRATTPAGGAAAAAAAPRAAAGALPLPAANNAASAVKVSGGGAAAGQSAVAAAAAHARASPPLLLAPPACHR